MTKIKIQEALKEGFKILRKNPIIFVPAVIIAILGLGLNLTPTPYLENGDTTSAMNYLLAVLSFLLLSILISLINLFLTSIIIRMVYDATQGEASLSKGVKIAVKKYPYLLISSILCILISFVGLIALVIPGIFLSIKLLYFDRAILIDNEGITNSLKKSWRITKGDWWTTFALSMFFIIIPLGLYLLLDMLQSPVSLTLNFIITLLLTPWGISSLTLAYLQLTRR